MESLHTKLLPYKELVGGIASVVTIAQFFSGAVMCKDIHNRKTTKGVSAIPFVGAVIIGILVFKYGLLLHDDAMLRVNMASVSLNLCYVAVFLYYCENTWEDVFKPASYGIVLVALLLGYAEWEMPEKIEYRYGLLVTILQLLLLASPLRDLANIIATKDASSIPFPIAFMAAIVTFLWFIYSIILNNIFMLVQNFVGFVLCIVQISLVFMYGSHLEEG